jgi:hypothetical protein
MTLETESVVKNNTPKNYTPTKKDARVMTELMLLQNVLVIRTQRCVC